MLPTNRKSPCARTSNIPDVPRCWLTRLRPLPCPSRTLVGPAGVKASAHLSKPAPGPPGRHWASYCVLLCWDQELGPTCTQSMSDRPAWQCRGLALFRMIDDFVRVLRWTSICFVGQSILCCLLRFLPSYLARYTVRSLSLSSLCSISTRSWILPSRTMAIFDMRG